MNIIQIIGKTGSGKTTLGRCVKYFNPDLYTHIYGGGMTPLAIDGLEGNIVLDDVRSKEQVEPFLQNDRITHLYIISESFIDL